MVEEGRGLISDKIRDALKVAACDLYLKKWDQKFMDGDLVSGLIVTEWKECFFAGRAGILFRAQFDAKDVTDYKVNFVMSEEDLGRGAEIIQAHQEGKGLDWRAYPAEIPIPELHEFHNLTGPSRMRH